MNYLHIVCESACMMDTYNSSITIENVQFAPFFSDIDWQLHLIRVFIVIALYTQFCRYMSGRKWSNPMRSDGSVCIVTGATSGIGRETAIGLAERGCHVVLACRDIKRAELVQKDICKRFENAKVDVHEVDLASLQSVRKFASEYRERYGTRRLDVLVLNAGVMGVPWRLTEDGLETHMAVNHYGHFALTLLLLDRMQATPNSRIVIVSSMSHRWVNLRPDDMNGERNYNRFHAYAHSKLANVMFTAALAQREGPHGVTVNCVHPGVIHTEVSRNLESLCWILQRNICSFFTYIALRSAKSGAICTLYAALDFNLQYITGSYFEDLWFAPINPETSNRRLCDWFWQHSEVVTGVTYKERSSKQFK